MKKFLIFLLMLIPCQSFAAPLTQGKLIKADINSKTSDSVVMESGGNIGVNSLIPGQKLDVQGTTRIIVASGGTALDIRGTLSPMPLNPAGLITVNGGGIAGELVNKGYELIIPSPPGLISPNTEVTAMLPRKGKLLIGYYDTASTGSKSAQLYVWDGYINKLLHSFGTGNSFENITSIVDFQGSIYVGIQGQNAGDGDIYVSTDDGVTWSKSYDSSGDIFCYALGVNQGKLYAGFGWNSSIIRSTSDGVTWSTSYAGLGGAPAGLVTDIYSYKGSVFASIGNGGASGGIVSSPDGVTWTQEASNQTFFRLMEFQGHLYATTEGTSPGELYVRNDLTKTWLKVASFAGTSQCDSIGVLNNALYVGCTITGGAQIFKSYDGTFFSLDFTNNTQGAQGTEAFRMANYNASLYIGMGFTQNTSADIWRKTDSIGQIIDWQNTFLNKFRLNPVVGQNWGDMSMIGITPPITFDSNVGIGFSDTSNATLSVNGPVGVGTSTPLALNNQNYFTVQNNVNGLRQIDIVNKNSGTSNAAGIQVQANDTDGYVRQYATNTANANGIGGRLMIINESGSGVGIGGQSANSDVRIYPNFGTTPTMTVTNNVGIGTITPGQQLEVIGTVKMDGFAMNSGSSLNGKALISDANGNGTWQTVAGSGSGTVNSGLANQAAYYATSSTAVSGTTKLTFLPNGNVGINTTSPAAQLEVNGTLNPFVITSTSSVGIGTLLPGSLLDVTGGNIQINGAAGSLRDLIFSASEVARWTIREDQDAETGSNIGSRLLFVRRTDTGVNNGAVMEMYRDTGNVRINNLGIGTISPGSQISVLGGEGIGKTGASSYVLNAAGSGNLIVEGNTGLGSLSPGSVLDVQGTTRMFGTGNTLDVQGTVRTQGFTLTGNNAAQGSVLMASGTLGIGTWSTLPAGGGGGSGTVNSGTAGQASYYATSTTAVSGTSDLIFNGLNVGIGSATPGQILDVQGTIRSFAFVQNTTAPNTFTGTATFNNATNSALFTGGNVGIGTILPIANLDIGSANVGAKVRLSGKTGVTWDYTIDTQGQGFKIVNDNTSPAYPFVIDGSGNVGIGTVTSVGGSQLSLWGAGAGTISVENTTSSGYSGMNMYNPSGTLAASFAYGNSAASPFGNAMFLGTRIASAPLQFVTNGINIRQTIDSNGNVGMGSSLPTHLFEVQGTSQFNIISNGNVGLGSSTPGQALDVQGTVRSLAFIQTGTSADTFTGTPTFSNATNSALFTGGNVGIGSTTPADVVFINYDISGGGNGLTVENQNSSQSASVVTLKTVAGNNAQLSLFNNNASWGSIAQWASFGASKGFLIQTNSGVSGSGTDPFKIVTGGFNNAASLFVQAGNPGNVGVGTVGPQNLFEVGTGKFEVQSGGNVGIGSVSPGQVLDVQGTIRTINFIAAGGAGSVGSVKTGANTACTTTCGTSKCLLGEDTSVVGTIVACTDATADICVCLGP